MCIRDSVYTVGAAGAPDGVARAAFLQTALPGRHGALGPVSQSGRRPSLQASVIPVLDRADFGGAG